MVDDRILPGDGTDEASQRFLDDVASAAVDALAHGRAIAVDSFLANRPDLGDKIRATIAAVAATVASPLADIPHVPGFEVLRLLGRGSTADVFLARQREHANRLVAIKLLRDGLTATAGLRKRFVDEAEALSRIDHPHVVAILGVFESEGVCGYVMEWVDGQSLAEILRWSQLTSTHRAEGTGGRLSVARICRMGVGIARALAGVHRAGFVHRDVKPSNILLDSQGTPKLSDFGLVRDVDEPHGTKTGWFVGTAPYAAPEQLRGDHHLIDARTDVYALGAVLYECLANEPPFGVASPAEALQRIERSGLRSLHRAEPRVPRELETIVCKALDPDPACRYPDAEHLADDLDRLLRLEPIHARPLPVWRQWARTARRRPVVAAMVAAAALIVTATATTLGYALPHLEIAWRVERDAAAEARLTFAWQELANGNLRDASRDFEAMLAVDSADVAALAGAVVACVKSKRFDQAEKLLVGRPETDRNGPAVSRLRAFVLRARGQTADANVLVESTPAPNTAIDFLLDAELALAAPGKAEASAVASALQFATEAIARTRTASIFAHLVRCEAAARGPDVLVRDRCIATLLSLWPDSANAHAGVGMILRRARDLVAAERHLSDAVRRDPNHAVALNALGNTLLELGRGTEAAARYRAAIAVSPDYAAAHYNLGNALLRLESWDEAIATFERAESLDPGLRFARLNLGVALSGAGRYRDAIVQFLAYGGANPSPRTLVNLAYCYARVGEAAKGNAAIDRALALVAGQPDYAAYLGHALLLLGRYEEALPFLRTGAAAESADPTGDGSCRGWCADCERLVGVEAALAEEKRGPQAAKNLLDRAYAAERIGRAVTAARLFRAAFEADSELKTRPHPPALVAAASAAAMASRGDAVDGDGQSLSRRSTWAMTAIDCLELQLELLEQDPANNVAETKAAWARRKVLAAVRDAAYLAELPSSTQARCRAFWSR